jgi:hypothetical protein
MAASPSRRATLASSGSSRSWTGGVAAALALGAQGVNMGTRFVASTELRVAEEWKQRLVAADALDAVKMINSERVLPPFNRPRGRPNPGLGEDTAVEALGVGHQRAVERASSPGDSCLVGSARSGARQVFVGPLPPSTIDVARLQ